MTERVEYTDEGKLALTCTGSANAVHTPYDGSWWEYDGRGFALCRVCYGCKAAKLARYRPEVLTDGDYWADEQIEED